MNTKTLSHNTNRDNEIYKLWQEDNDIEEIAKRYKLSISRIYQIINYKEFEKKELLWQSHRKDYVLVEKSEYDKLTRIYNTLLFDDLLEYEKGDYYITAEPYLSRYDGDIAWNTNIWKWDGTYSELKPNLPKDSKCKLNLKVKNRTHIQHITSHGDKPNLKELLRNE